MHNRTIATMVSKTRSKLISNAKLYCPRCGYPGWLSRRTDGYYRVVHKNNKSCYIGSLDDTAKVLASLGYTELLTMIAEADSKVIDDYKFDGAMLGKLIFEVKTMKEDFSNIKDRDWKERKWRRLENCPHCEKRVRVWFRYTGYLLAVKNSMCYGALLFPLSKKVNPSHTGLGYINVKCVPSECPACKKPVLIVVPYVGTCETWLDTGKTY